MSNNEKPTVTISFSFSAYEKRGYNENPLLRFSVTADQVPEGQTVVGYLAERITTEFRRVTGLSLDLDRG